MENKIEETLFNDVLKSYIENYNESMNTWHNLDNKAQGTVGISGIFIAGAFVFVTQTTVQLGIMWIFLVPILGALIVSVLFSLLSQRIRTVYRALRGRDFNRMVNELIDNVDNETELSVRMPDFIQDQIYWLEEATNSINVELDKKANLIYKSQEFLLLAIIGIGVFTIILLYRLS